MITSGEKLYKQLLERQLLTFNWPWDMLHAEAQGALQDIAETLEQESFECGYDQAVEDICAGYDPKSHVPKRPWE